MKIWARHSLAFLDSEKSGGILLVCCAIASLILSNSFVSEGYQHLWHLAVLSEPLEFWINDGLMTVFFLQVGLEIKREVYLGELNDFKKSSLPVLAAMGGMLVPALIHFALNRGINSQSGYGIPMATDIAFSLGILSLLGDRVPFSLKVFLTALAIIDDLGAIIVIAIFYSAHFSLIYLAVALGLFAILIFLNRALVPLWIYLLLGCLLWFCIQRSGIHATIAGVLLAFAIPLRQGNEKSPSSRLQHLLHKPVKFMVLPLFALANTAIVLSSSLIPELLSANSLGIILGLFIGKPLGIFFFSWVGVVAGLCKLPHTLKLKHIFSVGMLAGIGFTMSVFIAILAFDDAHLVVSSKMAVLVGSVISGAFGSAALNLTINKK